MRNRKYSRIAFERQIKVYIKNSYSSKPLWFILGIVFYEYTCKIYNNIIKILKLKMKHFNARMAFHKKKIKVKNDKIEAKKAENKK